MPEDRTPKPSSVYRIYDTAGTLIYVGLTDRGHARQFEHIASKPWAWQIAETHWEHFGTRQEAATRERHLIETRHPKHNIQHRDTAEDANPDVLEFRHRAEQLDLLRSICAEAIQLRKSLNRFTTQMDADIKAIERVTRALLRPLNDERPFHEHELAAARKFVAYLQKRTEREARERQMKDVA